MSEIEKLNMIAEWQEQHKQLIEDLDNSKKRITELEKENRELKTKLLQEREIYWCKGFDSSKDKLTKAKELLKGIVDTPMYNQMGGEAYENEEYKELLAEAEKFLKESEK